MEAESTATTPSQVTLAPPPVTTTPRSESLAPVAAPNLVGLSRRMLPRLFALWIVSFAAFVGYGLYVMPQTFTATISLAVQRQQMAQGGLGSLLGAGGTGAEKYIAALTSRRLAAQVAKQAGLKEYYNLPARKAVDKLMRQVHVTDQPRTKLLILDVQMAGPPRFGPDADARREIVEKKSADVANFYAKAVRGYMASSDVDREAVLLREADHQMAKARHDYDDSVDHLADYIRNRSSTSSVGSDTSFSGDAPAGPSVGSSPRAGQLQALYLSRGQIAVELQSALAAQDRARALLNGQLGDLKALPSEDQLLNPARNAVAHAKTSYDNLRIQYADESPSVVIAKQRLRNAEAELAKQMQAYVRGRTSDQVDADVKITSLRTKLAVVEQQLAVAERTFARGQVTGVDLERLRNEVRLQFEVLRSTASHRAELIVQNVSSKDQMAVLDEAIPPDSGEPRIFMILVMAAIAAAVLPALWFARTYLKDIRSAQDQYAYVGG